MAGKVQRIKEDDLDSLGREAFINLYVASNRFAAEVEELCRAEGLTMSHYTVLWFLSRRPASDGMPMGALADGHLNRASDMTRLADRLTTLGFLERLASESDRRVVLVRITESGRDVFVRLTARIRSLHREQWERLDVAELAELNRLLRKALWGEEATEARHPLVAAMYPAAPGTAAPDSSGGMKSTSSGAATLAAKAGGAPRARRRARGVTS